MGIVLRLFCEISGPNVGNEPAGFAVLFGSSVLVVGANLGLCLFAKAAQSPK